MAEEKFMRRALALAEKGAGWVSPNPLVGAVLVKDGHIIGEGYHEKYGGLHAERKALAACRESPEGGELYVTLEPCCHYGKQPPCTEAILAAGIRRVIVGAADPNPLVAGKGIAILRQHGVEVETGLLEEECRAQNAIFFHFIQTNRPYVAMKYAMSLDGKIACYTGQSRWISGEASRSHAHSLRHRYSGIMAGVGTILADDPLLTCRMEGGRNPVRIICDSHLRTPLWARVVKTAGEAPTILATCCREAARQAPYIAAGCRVLPVGEKEGHVDLQELMEKLGAEKLDSILLEGGGALNWSALSSGIVQKVYTYIAPMLLGGAEAKSPVAGTGFPAPGAGIRLQKMSVTRLGTDILLEGEVQEDVHGAC